MGQIASGFIPFVDIRDVLANLAHGDYVFAGLNLLGILSIDGDVTQVAGMVGRYISKHTNISEVAMVLEYLNTNYPEVVKVLAQSDEFVSVANRIANDLPKATQKEAESITNAFNNAGSSDYLIKGGTSTIKNAIPNADNAVINPSKLTDYALNPDHPVGGNTVNVRMGWIIRLGSDVPELTTLYVNN